MTDRKKPQKRNEMSDIVHRIKTENTTGLLRARDEMKALISNPEVKIEPKEPPSGR